MAPNPQGEALGNPSLSSGAFTSSTSEQVIPFPVYPSGQGPHWKPSLVSVHRTPRKQGLESQRRVGRVGGAGGAMGTSVFGVGD